MGDMVENLYGVCAHQNGGAVVLGKLGSWLSHEECVQLVSWVIVQARISRSCIVDAVESTQEGWNMERKKQISKERFDEIKRVSRKGGSNSQMLRECVDLIDFFVEGYDESLIGDDPVESSKEAAAVMMADEVLGGPTLKRDLRVHDDDFVKPGSPLHDVSCDACITGNPDDCDCEGPQEGSWVDGEDDAGDGEEDDDGEEDQAAEDSDEP